MNCCQVEHAILYLQVISVIVVVIVTGGDERQDRPGAGGQPRGPAHVARGAGPRPRHGAAAAEEELLQAPAAAESNLPVQLQRLAVGVPALLRHQGGAGAREKQRQR